MKKVIFIIPLMTVFNLAKAQNGTSLKLAECPHLIFKIGNGMSRMSPFALKSLNEATVEMSDFSKSDYKLQGFTFTVLSNNTQTFKTYVNKGNTFSEDTKAILFTVKPNDIIMFTGISVYDQSGNITFIQDRNIAFY